MTKKVFFLRFAGFLAIAMAAMPVFALTFNALIALDLIPEDLKDKAFGNALTFRAVIVWCAALLPGFAGIFPQESWRHVLYFAPMYAPALYAVVYTLMQ